MCSVSGQVLLFHDSKHCLLRVQGPWLKRCTRCLMLIDTYTNPLLWSMSILSLGSNWKGRSSPDPVGSISILDCSYLCTYGGTAEEAERCSAQSTDARSRIMQMRQYFVVHWCLRFTTALFPIPAHPVFLAQLKPTTRLT